MSAALVPGLILRAAPSSGLEVASRDSSLFMSPIPGLCGPYWTSAMGGGEGKRGELEGETPDLAAVTAVMVSIKVRTREVDLSGHDTYWLPLVSRQVRLVLAQVVLVRREELSNAIEPRQQTQPWIERAGDHELKNCQVEFCESVAFLAPRRGRRRGRGREGRQRERGL